jgi:hypothetical protein
MCTILILLRPTAYMFCDSLIYLPVQVLGEPEGPRLAFQECIASQTTHSLPLGFHFFGLLFSKKKTIWV